MYINNISQKASSFIQHKRFHPGNYKEMEKVWIAEEKAAASAQKEKQLQQEKLQEKRLEELRKEHGHAARDVALQWVTSNEQYARVFAGNEAGTAAQAGKGGEGSDNREQAVELEIQERSKYGRIDEAEMQRRLREDPLMLIKKIEMLKEKKQEQHNVERLKQQVAKRKALNRVAVINHANQPPPTDDDSLDEPSVAVEANYKRAGRPPAFDSQEDTPQRNRYDNGRRQSQDALPDRHSPDDYRASKQRRREDIDRRERLRRSSRDYTKPDEYTRSDRPSDIRSDRRSDIRSDRRSDLRTDRREYRDRDSPDRDSPDRDSPDRDSPDRDSPDRDYPDRHAAYRDSGEKTYKEYRRGGHADEPRARRSSDDYRRYRKRSPDQDREHGYTSRTRDRKAERPPRVIRDETTRVHNDRDGSQRTATPLGVSGGDCSRAERGNRRYESDSRHEVGSRVIARRKTKEEREAELKEMEEAGKRTLRHREATLNKLQGIEKSQEEREDKQRASDLPPAFIRTVNARMLESYDRGEALRSRKMDPTLIEDQLYDE